MSMHICLHWTCQSLEYALHPKKGIMLLFRIPFHSAFSSAPQWLLLKSQKNNKMWEQISNEKLKLSHKHGTWYDLCILILKLVLLMLLKVNVCIWFNSYHYFSLSRCNYMINCYILSWVISCDGKSWGLYYRMQSLLEDKGFYFA